jgi:hypothetical protein
MALDQLFLQPMPYTRLLARPWAQRQREGLLDRRLWLSLHAYSRSLNRTASGQARFEALQTSYHGLSHLCRSQPSGLRLGSLARAALDFGQRAVAVNALSQLVQHIQTTSNVDVSEPFLLPCPRYEQLPVKSEQIGNFVYASALEALNGCASYSSFYSPAQSLERLTGIEKLGFGSPAITNTIQLIRKRMAASSPAAT